MKQSGFLYRDNPRNYVLGVNSPLQGVEINPTGDWVANIPSNEKQHNINFDTFCCSTFSATNVLEMILNYAKDNGLLSESQIKWSEDNGYIEDGKFNFSDRFSATSNGTMPNGQYIDVVWDDFRHVGLIPEKDLPFGGKTQLEYLDRKNLTADRLTKAKNFLEVMFEKDDKGKYRLNYEWVPTITGIEMSEALKQAPLHVAVTKENPGHAIALPAMTKEFESYAPYLRDRTRSVGYCLKVVVVFKKETPAPTPAPLPPIENYFKTQEFVSKAIYQQYGESALWFVDPRVRNLANFVRKYFGKAVTINNWLWGGKLDQSGYREPESIVGGKMSQHRFGRAIDIKVAGMTPQQVYSTILANQKVFMDAGLTCMEDIADTPTWNHLDIRWTGEQTIKIVKP